MDFSTLAAAIKRPETHRKILGRYRCAYSLGIIRSPQDENEPALLLQVEGMVPPGIPSCITIDGQTVLIIKQGNFQVPVPLGRTPI